MASAVEQLFWLVILWPGAVHHQPVDDQSGPPGHQEEWSGCSGVDEPRRHPPRPPFLPDWCPDRCPPWTYTRPQSTQHRQPDSQQSFICQHCNSCNTHTCLTALFPGLRRWASTRKVKPIWISLKQETVSGSGISWAVCKSAPHSRQITTPALHHSVFYRPDALTAAQPTESKHWRKNCNLCKTWLNI